MLRVLNPTKDYLLAKFLGDAAEVITPSTGHIINMSIQTGKVPDELKMERVIPLHKKGSKSDPSNYRPVDILSALSKIVERIIQEQINEYISNNNILYEMQSGFRKAHSTIYN